MRQKRRKLDPKSLECAFLGYAENRSAFVLVHRPSGRIFESRDVHFDEQGNGEDVTRVELQVEHRDDPAPAAPKDDKPPLADTPTPPKAPAPEPESDADDSLSELSELTDSEDDGPPAPAPAPIPIPIPAPAPVRRAPAARQSRPPMPYPNPIPAPDVRRSGRNRQAPTRDDDPRYDVSSYNRRPTVEDAPDEGDSVGAPSLQANQAAPRSNRLREPLTYDEAMSGPDATMWKIACIAELEAFVKAKLYTAVDRPRNRKVIDSKWVFKYKLGPDGQIEKYKARLVAKGFTQVEGLDYNDTFAPVSKFSSIRTLLALAAKLDLEVHQMDVKSAFLNGDLEEEIFMEMPPGFKDDSQVWSLHKSIYGLKQASRAWYIKIRASFEELGFTRSHSDHSVFYQNNNGSLLIIAIYIDDQFIFSNDSVALTDIKDKLKKLYEMTDLGEVHWALNMEITRDRATQTLQLSQHQYIESILERHGMADCRSVSTPMAPNLKLPKLTEAEIDPKPYQSALGSVMYAMLGTRPDLAYAVGVLSQHASRPGKVHWDALMRVYRYLRGTTDYKIVYRGKTLRRGDDLSLLGFVDSDYAGDRNDCLSVSGYIFFLSGAAISWSSKKQQSTAVSSTEAEYMAGASAAKEAVWLRMFLSQLGQLTSAPTPLHIDNQSAIFLSKDSTFHERTKHIAVRHHFIREKVEDGEIEPLYVPTGDQVADV
ncbi:hypothetical protein EUX98_g798 [Antrodiella citrinella]|uniref:Uncharacterized protein n=1 Tax=Antrodiella citrinella TaxID=2447956 RepID=A0A4S4NBP7_9APHY|nr:hypothetical protein EUX98_g798 [Antrodiella citrinella]